MIIAGQVHEGSTLIVDADNGQLTVTEQLPEGK